MRADCGINVILFGTDSRALRRVMRSDQEDRGLGVYLASKRRIIAGEPDYLSLVLPYITIHHTHLRLTS